MEWTVKQFKDLTVDELYLFLKLRVDVFVVEQQCPYPEIDHKDRHKKTLHVMVRDGDGRAAAYLRVLSPGVSYPAPSFGRLAVAKDFRKTGLGHALVQKALSLIQAQWPSRDITIGAQAHLQDFYRSHGFVPVGAPYDEDGILHVDMVRPGDRA